MLGRNQPKSQAQDRPAKKDRKGTDRLREDVRQAKRQVLEVEKLISKLQTQISRLDGAVSGSPSGELAQLSRGELARRRDTLAKELELAEQEWLSASERLEQKAA